MVQITIDVPEDVEKKARMLKIELSLLIVKLLREKIEETEEIERFERSVAKSKLTEKDVEELTEKINEAIWKRHKGYEAAHS